MGYSISCISCSEYLVHTPPHCPDFLRALNHLNTFTPVGMAMTIVAMEK